MPYRVLNLDEVAQYLHLGRADVEALVRRGEIPHERQGSRTVFLRKDVDAWASQRLLQLPRNRLETYHKSATASARGLAGTPAAIVGELLQHGFVEPALASKTKAAVVRDMVDLAKSTDLVLDAGELLASLLGREELCSTALGGGIALLHPRHHDPYLVAESFVALARTLTPIPFGASDGQKTDLFFLICCQDDRLHLHVLARLCVMCINTDLLEWLRDAEDADSMLSAIIQAEEAALAKAEA